MSAPASTDASPKQAKPSASKVDQKSTLEKKSLDKPSGRGAKVSVCR